MDTLWIEGSPKGDDALSSQLAEAFLEGTRYQRFSVWNDDLLRFGHDAAVAKFAPLFGESVTARQQDIWQQVLDEIDAEGRHVGTLGDGKPVQLILTRSSAYDGRHPELNDFQRPYLEYVFGMLGYRVQTLVIEPTTRWTPDERAQMRAEAIELARRAGAATSRRSEASSALSESSGLGDHRPAGHHH
ncbi:MAG: flavodoxin family protein [Mycolicibacterium neoaurum]|uniref:flavodoxin family protein n=1 Tax=Mycolicibacterium neoaurum TaxID=1795 RepID=UPI002FF5823A